MPNNVKRRRRLADLYVRGKEVSIDDGQGEPVVVWLQKLNELDRDTVLRRANAAKARFQLEADQDESETFVACLTSVREFLDWDAMLALVIAEELANVRNRVEAQLTHDENGWGKEDKAQSLIEAWMGSDESPGLAATYAEDENDPEALRVKGELEAFEADVERGIEEEKARLELEWAGTSFGDMAKAATREVLKRKANEEFMREWSRQQVFICVRDPDDHHKRYFGTLAEVDDLDDRVREVLDDKCNELFVGLAEGKSSPATPASSTSSDLTSVAAQLVPSGHAAATP